MSARHYTFTLPADGQARRIDAMGTFFKVAEATSDAVIECKMDTGEVFTVRPGQGGRARKKSDGTPGYFRDLTIKSVSGGAVSGVVFVGSAESIDDRVTGVVSVVDGERLKVLAGTCYRGVVNSTGGGAAGPTMAVWNPSGTSVNLYLNALRVAASANDSYGLARSNNAPLITGSGTNVDPVGPVSAGRTAAENGGFVFGGVSALSSGYVSANVDQVMVFPRPILLRPGYGMYFYVAGAGTSIRGVFEWEEWPAA